MLTLEGIELNNGTPERRQALVEALDRIKNGEEITKPKRAPRPRAKRRPIPKTPEEIKAREDRRRESKRNSRKRMKEQIEQGLREAPPCRMGPKISNSKARFTITVGTWVTFRSRYGLIRTGRVLAHVPAGTEPPLPAGSTLKRCSQPGEARMARYLLVLPSIDQVANPPVQLVVAAEIEAHILELSETMPAMPDRLEEPLSNGTKVSWKVCGNGKSIIRKGVIKAFIPAGNPVSAILPEAIHARDSTKDVSIRDRYLVKAPRKRKDKSLADYSLPAAYRVEREWIKKCQKSTAA